MPSDIQESKAALREAVRARLRAMPTEHIVSASKTLCARLRELPCWSVAKCVLMFSALPQEPDIMRLVAESAVTKETLALPRFSPATQTYTAARVRHFQKECMLGKFNVLEPRPECEEVPLTQLDLILVPGVAFDLRGGRLGRGKGFYDRLLANVRGIRCGVAFDEQIVAQVPASDHDVRMDIILTPTRMVETAS